jgi:hypothetical protein
VRFVHRLKEQSFGVILEAVCYLPPNISNPRFAFFKFSVFYQSVKAAVKSSFVVGVEDYVEPFSQSPVNNLLNSVHAFIGDFAVYEIMIRNMRLPRNGNPHAVEAHRPDFLEVPLLNYNFAPRCFQASCAGGFKRVAHADSDSELLHHVPACDRCEAACCCIRRCGERENCQCHCDYQER